MDERSHIPQYILISDQIRLRLRLDGHHAGDRIPNEVDYCSEFAVSRGTIRKALAILVQEGVIERRKNAGTFVLGWPLQAPARKLIVAVVPNAFNPEFISFLQHLQYLALERDYVVSCISLNDLPMSRDQFASHVVKAGAAGAVVFPSLLQDREVDLWLRSHGVRTVVINDFWTDCRERDLVAYDECAAVEMAVDHLAGLGHRRLVLVEPNSGWARSRLVASFFSALQQRDLSHERNHLLLCDPDAPPLERLYGTGGVAPTAILTLYEIPHRSVIERLRRLKRRVPEDVSVVNLGCRPLYSPPGVDVTAVEAPSAKMAECALDLLLAKSSAVSVRHHLFKPVLRVGNTTAAAREPAPGAAPGAAATPRPSIKEGVSLCE